MLAHLHRVVPLVFLWEWSRGITSRGGAGVPGGAGALGRRGAGRSSSAGLLDGWLPQTPGMVRSVVGDGDAVLAASALPGTAGHPLVGLRLLAVSAFLRTLGYAAWVVFFPRVAPDATAPSRRGCRGRPAPRVWAGGFTVAAAVFAVLFAPGLRAGPGGARPPITRLPRAAGAVAMLVVLAGSGGREKVLPMASESTYGVEPNPKGGDPRSDFFRNV